MADSSTEPPTLDQWSYVDHKSGIDAARLEFPSWVPIGEQRRLTAYLIYASYRRNTARSWVQRDQTRNRREYGDPDVIVETLASGVISDSPSISSSDEKVQQWLDEWAAKETPAASLMLAATMAMELGDAVIVPSWDVRSGRPRLAVVDPGYYFPELSEDSDEFPDTVRIAWEFVADGRRWVRYRRWSLVRAYDDETLEFRTVRYPWGESEWECRYWDGVYPAGDVTSTRRTRERPWALFDERPAEWRTVIVDGEPQPAAGVSLGIDFIPVVHVPGSLVSAAEHWGASALGTVLQGLDELAATDTDTATAGELAGAPPIAVRGQVETVGDNQVVTYGPGSLYEGEMSALDTSGSLVALMKSVEALRTRVAGNARVGQTAQSFTGQWPSGFALSLALNPFTSRVNALRMAILPKLELALKMAGRLEWLLGDRAELAALPSSPITLNVGPAVPIDVDAEIERIAALYKAKLISRVDALEIIVPLLRIDRKPAELAKTAAAADYAAAGELMDAVNDLAAARSLLGLDTLKASIEETEPNLDPPA